MASIYGLFDAAGHLRYVGKADRPADRLKSHMRDARRRDTPLYRWIRKNGQPVMRVLEADCSDWKEAERRIIADARLRGCSLLNVAEGGDEPHCPSHVREANGKAVARAVHDNPRARRIWELKRAIGQALKQGYVREETKAKMRRFAAMHPDIAPEWSNV